MNSLTSVLRRERGDARPLDLPQQQLLAGLSCHTYAASRAPSVARRSARRSASSACHASCAIEHALLRQWSSCSRAHRSALTRLSSRTRCCACTGTVAMTPKHGEDRGGRAQAGVRVAVLGVDACDERLADGHALRVRHAARGEPARQEDGVGAAHALERVGDRQQLRAHRAQHVGAARLARRGPRGRRRPTRASCQRRCRTRVTLCSGLCIISRALSASKAVGSVSTRRRT